jgi:phasin family protein
MITIEQTVDTQKANLDTLTGLAGTAFEGIEKLIELNLSAIKTAMSEAEQTSQSALSVKDVQELFALQQIVLQPIGEKVVAYSRSVYEIAASTGAEMMRVAEAQSAAAQAKFLAIVDTALKNAPAGSEQGVAMIKSAMAAASTAIETAQKAAKRATEVAEANFETVTKSAIQATSTGPKAKRVA